MEKMTYTKAREFLADCMTDDTFDTFLKCHDDPGTRAFHCVSTAVIYREGFDHIVDDLCLAASGGYLSLLDWESQNVRHVVFEMLIDDAPALRQRIIDLTKCLEENEGMFDRVQELDTDEKFMTWLKGELSK